MLTKINHTQIDGAKDIYAVMAIYNLIEYSNIYSKTFGSFCQYYREWGHAAIVNSKSFKSKIKIAGKPPADGNTENVNPLMASHVICCHWVQR